MVQPVLNNMRAGSITRLSILLFTALLISERIACLCTIVTHVAFFCPVVDPDATDHQTVSSDSSIPRVHFASKIASFSGRVMNDHLVTVGVFIERARLERHQQHSLFWGQMSRLTTFQAR